MTTFNQKEVLLNIQYLIDKYRCSIDGFFTDSKTAAKDILEYLEYENILIKKDTLIELNVNKQSKAA